MTCVLHLLKRICRYVAKSKVKHGFFSTTLRAPGVPIHVNWHTSHKYLYVYRDFCVRGEVILYTYLRVVKIYTVKFQFIEIEPVF